MKANGIEKILKTNGWRSVPRLTKFTLQVYKAIVFIRTYKIVKKLK